MKTTALSLVLSVVAPGLLSIEGGTAEGRGHPVIENIFGDERSVLAEPLSPPEGQVYHDEIPDFEGTPPDGPPLSEETGEASSKEWTFEEWSNEPWPVQTKDEEEGEEDSSSAFGVGIVANDHNSCKFVLETEESCYDWTGPYGYGHTQSGPGPVRRRDN